MTEHDNTTRDVEGRSDAPYLVPGLDPFYGVWRVTPFEHQGRRCAQCGWPIPRTKVAFLDSVTTLVWLGSEKCIRDWAQWCDAQVEQK